MSLNVGSSLASLAARVGMPTSLLVVACVMLACTTRSPDPAADASSNGAPGGVAGDGAHADGGGGARDGGGGVAGEAGGGGGVPGDGGVNTDGGHADSGASTGGADAGALQGLEYNGAIRFVRAK